MIDEAPVQSLRQPAAAVTPDYKPTFSEVFSLSDNEFNEIRAFIRETTGISMGASKRQHIYRRLQTRLMATGIDSFRGYLDYLQRGNSTELEEFTNAVTTNLTSFFREQHHFDFLSKTVIPELVSRKGASSRRIRIWSAGCSTGEETYSIAMVLNQFLSEISRWDVKILATDLDTSVVCTGKTGIYAAERVEKIPADQLRRWFRRECADRGARVRVNQQLKDITTFKQLNLMADWPMRGRFDAIFCRNVIIYFDKATQRILIDRFADILEEDGYLILGHSESLLNVSDRFSLLGNTIYRKTC